MSLSNEASIQTWTQTWTPDTPVAELEKKSWGGPLKLVVDKLFKASQNRPIIELFKFFGWATSSLCGNLDQPKPKTDIKLYKISQSRPIIVDFLIFFGWAVAHPSP